ncbi:hypothetical protein GYMLUDRAFT_243304 [Collybiopsis luxurians FD-317 M1]|uniref:F-box domain-containing protein n=1 Tax=Collybiopsis luxurians FD-317 M1 TaxID=944289 RepID=A0A0D0CYU8_9AGAR|nr:hypothetical protein GYMLUDRAFT_243304 [Collybiopsis luxurians FD-317 M1]
MTEVSFLHLLTSNQPPDELEIPQIQSAILEAQQRLHFLDERLVELGSRVLEGDSSPPNGSASVVADELDVTRVHLSILCEEQRAWILRLQSPLSPVRRLPPEILALVFSFAFPSGDKAIPMDANSLLWRASQVCRTWREIICEGMQYIWSSIEIDCMKAESYNLTSTLLELALQRSGTRSLSIRFCFSRRNPLGVLSETEKRCLNLLTNNSFRWEELELDYVPIAVLDSLSIAVRGRIPLLRRLVILNVPMSLSIDTPSTAEAFEFAPRLEHFSLSGYFRPSRFQLPWSQLTSYTGSFRDIRDFFVVLEYANNLATCDVFLRNFHPGFTIEHSNLRTLRIRGALDGLSRLRLPLLRTLVLDELIVQDLKIISVFIRRTPTIEALEVHIPHESGGGNSKDILLDFMTACRNVSSLVFMGEVDVRTICSLLDMTDPIIASRALMPRLTHLSLSVLSTANAELADVLAIMIESRQHPTLDHADEQWATISSLTLHALRVPVVILERLKPLEALLGLRVAVKIASI